MYSLDDGFLTRSGCYSTFKKEMGIPLAKKYLYLYFDEMDGFYKEKKISWGGLRSEFIKHRIYDQLKRYRGFKKKNVKTKYMSKIILPKVEAILSDLMNPIQNPIDGDLHARHVANQIIKHKF